MRGIDIKHTVLGVWITVWNQKYQHLESLNLSFFSLRYGDVQLQGHGSKGPKKDPEQNGNQVYGADDYRRHQQWDSRWALPSVKSVHWEPLWGPKSGERPH